MTEKRYTIKSQDDLFGIVDNYSPDKICVINGIWTEIEAEWLCKDMNTLNDENEQLKQFKEKVFFLFDEEIAKNKEAIEWGKKTGADCGSIGFYNHMLKMLKKELQE